MTQSLPVGRNTHASRKGPTARSSKNVLIAISERQRAARVEHHLAAIVESSDDAIISGDLNGTVTTWNKAAERLFGYLAKEAVGKSITILMPADRLNEGVEILERIRRGEHSHFETVRRRKDGSLVVISLTVSPVIDDSGKIIGASEIARDITEQKRREGQINLLAREAEHRTKNLLAIVQTTVQLAQGRTAAITLSCTVERSIRHHPCRTPRHPWDAQVKSAREHRRDGPKAKVM
jgi:PAS domain S-box-containing protein